MRTIDEQNAWAMQCFGCTLDESRAGIDHLADFHRFSAGGANMALGSILSDVQELIERGRVEQARQLINRVKHAIFEAAPITLWGREKTE